MNLQHISNASLPKWAASQRNILELVGGKDKYADLNAAGKTRIYFEDEEDVEIMDTSLDIDGIFNIFLVKSCI